MPQDGPTTVIKIVIGETVGSYRLLAKLGVGGMGEVYLADHKYIARRAAIKFLLPELSRSSEVVLRFFNEARAASMIQHPGIVEVLDCEVHKDGRAFIVMEALRGENVRAYIERVGKLDGDVAGATAICRQMVSALGAAHGQGIVHRDLKPDNVFLHVPTSRAPAEPIVKLLDFGIAKLQGTGEAGTHTRTGQMLGTPLYMSPEQCRGARQVDSRSDIYSLGCIMFEMFCGRPPFVAEGLGDLVIAHVSQPPPDPLEFAPGLAPGIREMLLRCLAKEPADRPTVDDLTASLDAAGAREVVRLAVPVKTTEPAVAIPARVRSPVEPTVPEPAGSMLPQAGHAFAAGTRPRVGAQVGAPAPTPGGRPMLPTPPPTTLGGGAVEVVVPGAGRRRLVRITLGTLSLGLIAAGLTIWQRTPANHASPVAAVEPPKPPAAEPAARVPAVPADPVPAPRPPPPAAITLTGVPAEAAVRLDGQPASSPVAIPRGNEKHRITVDADGFERWEQSVDGMSDQTLAVRLKPKPPQARAKVKAKQKSERNNASPGFSGFSDL